MDLPPWLEEKSIDDLFAVDGNFPLFPVPHLTRFNMNQLFQTPPEAIVSRNSNVDLQSESAPPTTSKENVDSKHQALLL